MHVAVRTSSSPVLVVAIAAVVLLLFKILSIGRRPKGYPPGPPTFPFIGNLHQFPRENLHLQFQKWTQEYGPIVSLKLGTQTLILLGTATAVSDLLEKRSSNYSTRMDMFFRDWNQEGIFFRPYDDTWKKQRRVYQGRVNGKLANNYLPYQYFETHQLMHELLMSPAEYRHHLERYTISIGSTIAFGRRIPSADDPIVATLLEWFRQTVIAGSGLQIADWWPLLRPVIRAIPFAINPIKKWLARLHFMERDLWVDCVEVARQHMLNNRFYPSLCRDMLVQTEKQAKDSLTYEELLFNSGHAWGAATDTQSNTLLAFVKAMVLYPAVQRMAQEEIDRVIGSERLPEWEDRSQLPYLRGCVQETLRWAPTTLTGGPMPHATFKEDNYMGYTIPAGAGVMNCVWTINNDPIKFAEPRTFNPSRFMEEDTEAEAFGITQNYEKRPHGTFGAGRRVCPGSHVAERTLFITMARLIWAFKFDRKLDASGQPIAIEQDAMTEGLVVGPAPFECDIQPRTPEKAALLHRQYEESNFHLDSKGNYTEDFFRDKWTAGE